jgi:hypothetical protein
MRPVCVPGHTDISVAGLNALAVQPGEEVLSMTIKKTSSSIAGLAMPS